MILLVNWSITRRIQWVLRKMDSHRNKSTPPEANLHVADKGEPCRPVSRVLVIMLGKHPPHNVFIDVDAKGSGDFQGDPGSAESGIAALHLQDKLDEL
jgi:hypothetical protein